MGWFIAFILVDLAFLIHTIQNWKTYDDYDKIMIGYIISLALAGTGLSSIIFFG